MNVLIIRNKKKDKFKINPSKGGFSLIEINGEFVTDSLRKPSGN